MKFIWEPKDIKGGRIVIASGMTEETGGYIIAYQYNNGTIYSLVALSDGSVCQGWMNKAAMAGKLTELDMSPKSL